MGNYQSEHWLITGKISRQPSRPTSPERLRDATRIHKLSSDISVYFSAAQGAQVNHFWLTVVTGCAVIFTRLVFRFVTMIHVRQLTKAYKDIQQGHFTALDGISFDAMPGQIYGLLGPNGAGKTTALRILSTVLKPTSGSAIVNGFDVVINPNRFGGKSVSFRQTPRFTIA